MLKSYKLFNMPALYIQGSAHIHLPPRDTCKVYCPIYQRICTFLLPSYVNNADDLRQIYVRLDIFFIILKKQIYHTQGTEYVG